ncbi:hypothetical protein NPIL_654421 [Nephila pilipes]|uniref:Uncharacterized protein n=1 Tax=Nephila pilipes TaxID=299642 RepID=A0A8X6PS82_NEPPI|nr:hypothetical protein NPIL_654421 [Nephila pilipes]
MGAWGEKLCLRSPGNSRTIRMEDSLPGRLGDCMIARPGGVMLLKHGVIHGEWIGKLVAQSLLDLHTENFNYLFPNRKFTDRISLYTVPNFIKIFLT